MVYIHTHNDYYLVTEMNELKDNMFSEISHFTERNIYVHTYVESTYNRQHRTSLSVLVDTQKNIVHTYDRIFISLKKEAILPL